MTGDLDDGTACRAFERALHESTVIADRIREAIADAPPKLVMLALSDLLQEHLTRLVMAEPDTALGDGRAGHGANAAPESALVAGGRLAQFPTLWPAQFVAAGRSGAVAPELTGDVDPAVARNRHSARAVRFGTPIFV